MKKQLTRVAAAASAIAVCATLGLSFQDGDKVADKAEQAMEEAPKVAKLGKRAPNFKLMNLGNEEVILEKLAKEKIVVLEWFNPECPFVAYAYKEGPLLKTARKAREKGIVWLAINSGAPGQQGTGREKNKKYHDEWDMPQPILFDEEGTVGQMYDARTTPQIVIIDKDMKVVYMGALDNAPRGKVPEGENYKNYAWMALENLMAGEKVEVAKTRPYGCSVKYAKPD